MCASVGKSGSVKEASLLVEGEDSAFWLAYKPSVHRVGAAKAKGRVHTSAATVAILTAADNINRIRLVPSKLGGEKKNRDFARKWSWRPACKHYRLGC